MSILTRRRRLQLHTSLCVLVCYEKWGASVQAHCPLVWTILNIFAWVMCTLIRTRLNLLMAHTQHIRLTSFILQIVSTTLLTTSTPNIPRPSLTPLILKVNENNSRLVKNGKTSKSQSNLTSGSWGENQIMRSKTEVQLCNNIVSTWLLLDIEEVVKLKRMNEKQTKKLKSWQIIQKVFQGILRQIFIFRNLPVCAWSWFICHLHSLFQSW